MKNLIHKIIWKYGVVGNQVARKNRFTGRVQFIVHRKGKMCMGIIYPNDYWADFDSTWWKDFK